MSLFSGSTVLLVDDSDDIRLMLKQMLLMNNYRVIEASNGQEAIEIVHERCPDLILVDLNMPRLDGLSLVEKVRALKGKCEGVPIIAMTAFHTYGMKEAAIQTGCNEYITKPIEMERLEKSEFSQLTICISRGVSSLPVTHTTTSLRSARSDTIERP